MHSAESETVGSIMTHSPKCIGEDATIREFCDCMRSNVFKRIPVVSKGRLPRIISRRDIVSFMKNQLECVDNLESFLDQ